MTTDETPVPLTFGEIETIILRLQESQRQWKDADDQALIDKLRGYLKR